VDATSLKLALGQLLIEPGAVAGNLDRATATIADASRQNCRLIVLPECLDIGCSLAVGADGEPVTSGPYAQEALIAFDVELCDNPAKGTDISGML